MGGGAWPFLVGGVICLVNSDNERDSFLLTSAAVAPAAAKHSSERDWRLSAARDGAITGL